MAERFTVHVGTIGHGPWRSIDGGQSWQQGRGAIEHSVRAILAFPDAPAELLAGTDEALLASGDGGEHWRIVDSYEADRQTWSLTVDPNDTDTIFAGGQPGLRRSHDRGQTWEQLPVPMIEAGRYGVPQVTSVLIDPLDSRRIYAGVEVDGVKKSFDGGDTWTQGNPIGTEYLHEDVHGMGRAALPSGVTVFATNPFGVSRTDDEGESWTQHEFAALSDASPRPYCRAMLVKPDDPSTVFVGCGDTYPGTTGAIWRSTDGGRSWAQSRMSPAPNSLVFCVETHPAAPEIMAAATIFGNVYTSTDGGALWQKCETEFGEIRALAISVA